MEIASTPPKTCFLYKSYGIYGINGFSGQKLNTLESMGVLITMTNTEGDMEEVLPAEPHAISASRIHAWMFCSRSHQLKYDLGMPGIVGPAAKVGVKFHDRIANALAAGEEPLLPKAWRKNYNKFLSELNLSDNLLIEKHLTGMAQGSNIQGYLDILDLDQAFILDWKTGKVRPYPVQAYIYTMLVEQLIGEPLPFYYCYLKYGKMHLVTKEDLMKGRKIFEKFVIREDDYLPHFDCESNKCLKCSYRIPCAAVCQGL